MERKRFVLIDCLLWFVPGVCAVLVLANVTYEYFDGFSLNRIGMAIGLVYAMLTSLGLFLRWGPIIPCMFLGMIVFSILTDPIASSAEEAVFKDLGVPLLGAICGAILGFVIESLRFDSQGSAQDD